FELLLRAASSWNVVGALDDSVTRGEPHRLANRGVEVIGVVSADALGDRSFVVGVGYPAGRHAVVERLPAEHAAPALVDPSAVVSMSAYVADGAAVFWNASVSPLVTIGPHSFVSYGATVGHDTQIGAFVSVMPGARLSGDVTIGDGVVIGTGAVVL